MTPQGPDNARVCITRVPSGTPEGGYAVYTYTNKCSPLSLQAPDAAGDYELRYPPGAAGCRTRGQRAVACRRPDYVTF